MAWSEFDTKMACLAAVPCSVVVGGLLLLASCTTEQLNTTYQQGQLFCAAEGSLLAAVDAATGKAYTVTNKPAATVAAVCKAIGGIPVNTPAQPLLTPAVTIVPPLVSALSPAERQFQQSFLE